MSVTLALAAFCIGLAPAGTPSPSAGSQELQPADAGPRGAPEPLAISAVQPVDEDATGSGAANESQAHPADETKVGPEADSPAAPGGKEAKPAGDNAAAHRPVEFAPGRGVAFTSVDNKFQLRIGMFTQILYTVAHDLDADDTSQAISIRRARLKFGGHVFGPHNKFFVHLAVSPQDLQVKDGQPTKTPIFDWFFELDHLRDLTFKIGQYRVPFSRQRRIPIGRIMMADRSLANFEFNLDRDVGLSIRSADIGGLGYLRYDAGVFIGEGRDAFDPQGFGMIYVGRVEVLPMGMFNDYDETDRGRGKKPRLSLGVAYAYHGEAKGNKGILGDPPTDGGTTDNHNVTADLLFKIYGVTLSGSFYWRDGRRDYGTATVLDPVLGEIPAPLQPSRDGLGWDAQAGWLVPRTGLELGLRHGFTRDLGEGSSLPPRDEAAASVGYLIFDPVLKVVADYTRGWPQGDLDRGTHQGRVQLQVTF